MRRRRKTKHEKLIELLNTQAVQNLPYVLAKMPPEVWMGAAVLFIEHIKPKHPGTNTEPMFTLPQIDSPLENVPEGSFPEEGWQIYRWYGGMDSPQQKPTGGSVALVTKLPTITTHSPPDLSGMDVYTALQVSLLFAIAVRNIKVNWSVV